LCLQTIIHGCIKRIFKLFWPQTISNEHPWQIAKENPIIPQVKGRKWKWIGHTLRTDSQAIERQVLNWYSQGRRKRERPLRTRKRTVQEEIRKVGKTWKKVGALAQNRIRWRCFVEGLCS
jgi:hypothetical protein